MNFTFDKITHDRGVSTLTWKTDDYNGCTAFLTPNSTSKHINVILACVGKVPETLPAHLGNEFRKQAGLIPLKIFNERKALIEKNGHWGDGGWHKVK